MQRTATAMVKKGIPFSGVLFAGLMIKDGKVNLPATTCVWWTACPRNTVPSVTIGPWPLYLVHNAILRRYESIYISECGTERPSWVGCLIRHGCWSTMCALGTRSASASWCACAVTCCSCCWPRPTATCPPLSCSGPLTLPSRSPLLLPCLSLMSR